MNAAEGLFWLARIWLIAGGLVAALFLTVGIDRIDEDARGAYVFRPLLIPGILLIWPLVLWRWWTLESGRFDPNSRYRPVRAAHGLVAIVLCIVVLGTIILGLSVRQHWPADVAPQRLTAFGEVSQ
ncbi:hypothetical protein [Ruegeria sp. HKCCD8929]|uniref:hypothetical protein n=1 Tax=Ruegeria sp. HKCCD8929 TaxID=2683006 RepID=UPI001487BB96|nr:hypothetical protein [Ruegeria sp. HKCCD8929]